MNVHFIVLVLLILMCSKISTNETLLEINTFDVNKFKCIIQIFTKIFQSPIATEVSLVIIGTFTNHSNSQDVILNMLMQDNQYNFSLMVKNPNLKHGNASRVIAKASNYLMLLQNVSDVSSHIKQWQSLPTWNPFAQVLIIFMDEIYDYVLDIESEIKNIFQYLLQNEMLFVHVLYEIENSTMFETLTWYPYENGNCADYVNTLHSIYVCDYSDTIIYAMDMTMIKRQSLITDVRYSNITKIPINLQYCPLRITTFQWKPYISYNENDGYDGIEVALVKVIAEKLKLTIKFKLLNETFRFSDNNTIFYSSLLNK